MNSLDRIMKKERKRRYKRLKKLFKARDMASKYINRIIRVSLLDKSLPRDIDLETTTGVLAKHIVDTHKRILGLTIRPPKPPKQDFEGRKTVKVSG
jgi:hypothetical protein